MSALRRWVDVCVEELDVIATRDAVAYRWRHALLRGALSEWRWQAAAAWRSWTEAAAERRIEQTKLGRAAFRWRARGVVPAWRRWATHAAKSIAIGRAAALLRYSRCTAALGRVRQAIFADAAREEAAAYREKQIVGYANRLQRERRARGWAAWRAWSAHGLSLIHISEPTRPY